MVADWLKYLFALALATAVFLPASARRCEIAPADTTLVFDKMPVDTVVVREPVVKKSGKKRKTVPKKKSVKKAKTTETKSAPKRTAKKNSDSVQYEQKRYSLGDRVIMRGDSGADVKKLAEIMVKNLYLDENAIPYTKSGEVLYDGELLRAVKLFQKVSGLYNDGMVGSTTIKELRKIHRWRKTAQ